MTLQLATYLLLLALAGYLVTCAALFLHQDRLVFRPSRTIERTPQDVGLRYQDVERLSADGLRLHAWMVERRPEAGWILYCHGNADNVSSRLDLVQVVHDAGYNLLIFDYRGYGRSEGQPSELGLYHDAWCFWEFLRNDLGVPAGRIVVAGDSLGGAVAAALAEREQPAGLILAATFTSLPELASEMYPYLPMHWICRHRFATHERVQRIDCPKLIMHSYSDERIAPHHGERLFAASVAPRQWCTLSGAHALHLASQPEGNLRVVLEFVERALR